MNTDGTPSMCKLLALFYSGQRYAHPNNKLFGNTCCRKPYHAASCGARSNAFSSSRKVRYSAFCFLHCVSTRRRTVCTASMVPQPAAKSRWLVERWTTSRIRPSSLKDFYAMSSRMGGSLLSPLGGDEREVLREDSLERHSLRTCNRRSFATDVVNLFLDIRVSVLKDLLTVNVTDPIPKAP